MGVVEVLSVAYADFVELSFLRWVEKHPYIFCPFIMVLILIISL